MRFIFSAFVLLLISVISVYGEKCPQKDSTLTDQNFGLPLTVNDVLSSMMGPWMFKDYFRPWRYLESLTKDVGSTIKVDKDKFQINLDVQHFRPEEITVKTKGGFLVVEAKHEEKEDAHGFISRKFARKYALPEDVKSEDVVAELSSDGILTITALRKEVDGKGLRIVPITKTGPAKMESKESVGNREENREENELCPEEECEY